MKDEFGGKITKELLLLRAKAYSYLIGDSSEDNKAKVAKMCQKKKTFVEIYKTV